MLAKKGIEFDYEPEEIPYRLDLKYNPDWKIGNVYIETKGKFDYDSRRKMLAVISQNPDKDIRLVFMRNNKLGKGSKTKYGDWCDKHGIKWSVFPALPIGESDGHS